MHNRELAARAYIGTSGWNYKHWRNLIYPPRFAQKNWLHFNAEHFDTVEVNTSFYRIPKWETIDSWQRATPAHFLFALKLWRGITHYKKLKDAGTFTANFLDVVDTLEPSRRGPLLIQLPPNQGRDVEKLQEYLCELRALMKTPWPVAVEFRNSSWLEDEVYRILDNQDVALCIHDMIGKAETDTPNRASFVYVRRHGSARGRYSGSYSPEQIDTDAAHIRAWVAEGRSVYVYYNNDIGGHAFWNAEQLKRAVS